MTRSTSKALVAWRQWCRLISLVDHPILSYMYNFHRQMMHLQLKNLLLVERNTRPLPELHNESDADPPREAGPDRAEVALFSEPEPIPTIPEDVEEGSDDEEEDLQFRAYSPPAHMYNIDLSQDDALEFPNLPHRRCDRTSSSLDLGELEVGKEFSNKDSFLGALKQHSIMNGVNYNVVKSKSNKFEAKCAVQDGTCLWKIMASLRKKTGLWEIKKYKGPHTCAAGVSKDHPKMNSDMLATLILPTMKVDPRTSVPVLLANIRSQLRYRPSYHKACIAKQKVLEKIHGCVIDLETEPAYYNDQLLRGCQVVKRLIWTFKQCQDAFLYCKPLVQINGTRHLPITSVVQETYFHLVALFLKRVVSYKGQMQVGRVWGAKVLQAINKAKAQVNTMHTVYHDRDNLWFHVTKFDRPHEGIIGGQYREHLRNKTCDCGRFGALHYPCAHVIAACQNLRLDPMSYVDEVYELETMYNVWRHIFSPVPYEHNWPSVSLAPFKLLPDRELRRKPKGQNQCHMGVVDGSVLDSSFDQLAAGVVVPSARDLVVAVGRVTQLDRIMIAAVFTSRMAEVFESRKVMGIGRKKSSPIAPHAISHATAAYRSEVDSE
ncbi:hypothetical protein GOBAR_AA20008 [Gossypium barbadense]|uniref:SWIM-type domain-containing protein n=1 Tax=Gossypium barbadense TaxID=3634 RepID=A0A2P5XBF9_GOSBA|nr:hypothetical protein GOBAR_AA20008 [Gossypium barbadense]